MYKTSETAKLIAQTAGRFFACEFIKKDGTAPKDARTLRCAPIRHGARSHIQPG